MKEITKEEQLFFGAASNNDLEGIKKFLKDGGDINTLDNYGYSALMLSARSNFDDCFNYLIDKGIDIHIESLDHTALSVVAINGTVDMAKKLIDSNKLTIKTYGCALYCASFSDNKEVLEELMNIDNQTLINEFINIGGLELNRADEKYGFIIISIMLLSGVSPTFSILETDTLSSYMEALEYKDILKLLKEWPERVESKRKLDFKKASSKHKNNLVKGIKSKKRPKLRKFKR